MISLIHPSRGRPEKSVQCIDRWLKCATNHESIELIVSCDSDDEWADDYSRRYEYTVFKKNPVIRRKNRSAIDAINVAAFISTGDILIVVSDDTETIPGWDRELIKICEGKKDFILKTQDGIQKWIITMPVLDRAYYNRFGYIYHPDYLHMFCDTELTCVADLTGRKIESNLLFPHKHYSVTKEQPDAINKKADATWSQGETLFIQRAKNKFGLKPEDIKGKVTSQDYINWARNKGIQL